MKMRFIILLLLASWLAVPSADAAEVKKRDTIKSLEKKDANIRSGKVIVGSTDLARDNYRAFLDLVSDDPELRAEAMRRLGDLEGSGPARHEPLRARCRQNCAEIQIVGHNAISVLLCPSDGASG